MSPTLSKFLLHRPPAAHIHAIFLAVVNFIMAIPGTLEASTGFSTMSPHLCFCNVSRKKAFLMSARRIYTISSLHFSPSLLLPLLIFEKHLRLPYGPPPYGPPQKPLYNFFPLTGGGLLPIIYSIRLKHKSPCLQLPPAPPRHNPSIRPSRHSPGILFPSGLFYLGSLAGGLATPRFLSPGFVGSIFYSRAAFSLEKGAAHLTAFPCFS